MDAVAMFEQSAGPTRAVVAAVPAEKWSAQSPCTEWSVRDVVNHLTSEHLWAPDLLAGRTIEEVGDRYEGDVVGDDPAGAFEAALDASLAAVGEEGVAGRTVHLSYGDSSAAEYLMQMAGDLLVHGWDVAAGAGVPYEPDPDVAAAMLALAEPMLTDEVRATGIVGPKVEVPVDAPAFDRLLGVFGRDPGWPSG